MATDLSVPYMPVRTLRSSFVCPRSPAENSRRVGIHSQVPEAQSVGVSAIPSSKHTFTFYDTNAGLLGNLKDKSRSKSETFLF